MKKYYEKCTKNKQKILLKVKFDKNCKYIQKKLSVSSKIYFLLNKPHYGIPEKNNDISSKSHF